MQNRLATYLFPVFCLECECRARFAGIFEAEWGKSSLKSDYISDLEKYLMQRIEGLMGLRGNAP
jgi:hypothetical protein